MPLTYALKTQSTQTGPAEMTWVFPRKMSRCLISTSLPGQTHATRRAGQHQGPCLVNGSFHPSSLRPYNLLTFILSTPRPRWKGIQEQRPHATQKSPSIMLRRPPTVISLTENDLQFHLERIFARSSPPNIDELSLEEADQRSSEGQQPSTDKSAERLDNRRRSRGSNEGSSCMTRSSLMAAQTHSTGLPVMNGSTHRTIVDPNRAATAATTTAQLISSNVPQARASQLREPLASHPRTELTIPPQEFLDRHILPSPDGKKGPSAAPDHKS